MKPRPPVRTPSVERPFAVIVVSVFGMVGVALYIAAWSYAGTVIPAYDPLRQAISETFAIGAPFGPSTLVRSSLVVSGVALVGFAWALDHGLPGRGRTPSVFCSLAGLLTAAVAGVPCTRGCPGFGHSVTDTLHVVTAGGGYLALMLTPLAVAWRVRTGAPVFARLSLLLGGTSLIGFAVRTAGLDVLPGLQQRTFNTVADAWFLVAGGYLVWRVSRAHPEEGHGDGTIDPVAGTVRRPRSSDLRRGHG